MRSFLESSLARFISFSVEDTIGGGFATLGVMDDDVGVDGTDADGDSGIDTLGSYCSYC